MEQASSGIAAEGGIVVDEPGDTSPVLLVCEHAGNRVPARYGDLGVTEDVLASHVAWDPGAHAVSRGLSRRLGAVLVAQTVSRLVYDCNRPPDALDAMPARSEVHAIPGNAGLSQEARGERVRSVYRPFEAQLKARCDAHAAAHAQGAVLTIHSFTPTFHGRPRSVEIGVLHGEDRRLADALLAVAGATSEYDVRRNAPYGPEDGVLHTLDTHAAPRGLLHAMIEIRNDLIATPEACEAMAERLADWTRAALDMLAQGADTAAARTAGARA